MVQTPLGMRNVFKSLISVTRYWDCMWLQLTRDQFGDYRLVTTKMDHPSSEEGTGGNETNRDQNVLQLIHTTQAQHITWHRHLVRQLSGKVKDVLLKSIDERSISAGETTFTELRQRRPTSSGDILRDRISRWAHKHIKQRQHTATEWPATRNDK